MSNDRLPHARNRAAAAAYRAAVAVAGTCVVLLGLVLVPLPGPGWPIVFLGLVVLGSEFSWAGRVRHVAQSHVTRAARWSASAAWPVRTAVHVAAVGSLVVPVLVLAGWL